MTPEIELQLLKQKLERLENFMNSFVFSDRYISQKHLQLAEARDINFGSNKGTRIAPVTTQKLSFWGQTPISQPSSTGETAGMTAPGGTNATNQSTFTGNNGSTAYTISDLVSHLKNLGILLK